MCNVYILYSLKSIHCKNPLIERIYLFSTALMNAFLEVCVFIQPLNTCFIQAHSTRFYTTTQHVFLYNHTTRVFIKPHNMCFIQPHTTCFIQPYNMCFYTTTQPNFLYNHTTRVFIQPHNMCFYTITQHVI